jgi:ATP-dependent Clp protease ATP-binding subunit ClpX
LRNIIGQDKQVRQIITSIYRAINFKTIKSNVLIVGSSGTGKTETIKQIAKRLHIPYTIEDATKYTKEGYYGADVNDMIFNLITNAKYDIRKAQKGIIIIDEIDKKASNNLENDVAGAEVLKSLLKLIEGTRIKVEMQNDLYETEIIDFDTKDITIIFCGAFSGLDKIRDKRINVNPIGFSFNQASNEINEKPRFIKKDLVEYGMPEEFVGRIDTIIEMNKLTKEDLSLILRKSKLSIFKRYQRELNQKGITLFFDPKLFDKIAEESLSLDTGARELSNTVNFIFENIIYEVLANPGKYTQCQLELDIVHDNTKFKLS